MTKQLPTNTFDDAEGVLRVKEALEEFFHALINECVNRCYRHARKEGVSSNVCSQGCREAVDILRNAAEQVDDEIAW